MVVDKQESMFFFERLAWQRGFNRVAGIDEVGRGPLAGPVVAAAVVLQTDDVELLRQLTDSKMLSEVRRQTLARQLRQQLQRGDWSIAAVEPVEIDRLNILRATHLAMKRALSDLSPEADFALVDGLPVEGLSVVSRAIVKGDQKSASVAAASILAKVYRDSLMEIFDNHFPGYGFACHKGYGTPSHLRALQRLGPCPVHRNSFAPVARCLPGAPVQCEFKFTDLPDDS